MKNLENSRKNALKEAISRQPRSFSLPRNEKGTAIRISEYFGVNTFDLRQMKDKLPREVFQRLQSTVRLGKKLETDIAQTVSQVMKEWALSKGASHFCHWFQPQTGLTAEKHDAFLSFDDNQHPIEGFSAAQLIQSEPDASSFPSGGMRATFEARGYTAWDPSSPVFIMEAAGTKTLCIPSAFISYHGDALDEKTPLLRSIEVLSERATKLLKLLGDKNTQRVITTLGCEQEYFLIDRAFFALRPDLIMSGRTLLGGQPPKGQQLEDHYFGAIPERVSAFMGEFELELHKLGVPIKTRHNEVAPSQYESAPIFEEANLAVDHNYLVMEMLKKVALRHGYQALLHEKPFAGLNGTGKHCNWSMSVVSEDSEWDGTNLLNPGQTPHQNIRFLMFLSAVLKGVTDYSGLLRAGIASSGNDHRLGANEAPPAIISVFLGELLHKILEEIAQDKDATKNAEERLISLGVGKLPTVMKDNTDRNRTSPFAFTGNKFEFRAVGGSATPAFPIMLLNAAVADAIGELTDSLEKKIKTSKSVIDAALAVVKEVVLETKAIRFEGNNYSQEWVVDAEKRGLPNLRKTPESLAQLESEKSKRMLTSLGVLSEAELHSRHHVKVERYVKNLQIEVDTLRLMIDSQIFPAVNAYMGQLAGTVSSLKAANVSAGPQSDALNKIVKLAESLHVKRGMLESAYAKVEKTEDFGEKAKLLALDVSTAMANLRESCDEIEALVDDDFWPLPKYREMVLYN